MVNCDGGPSLIRPPTHRQCPRLSELFDKPNNLKVRIVRWINNNIMTTPNGLPQSWRYYGTRKRFRRAQRHFGLINRFYPCRETQPTAFNLQVRVGDHARAQHDRSAAVGDEGGVGGV